MKDISDFFVWIWSLVVAAVHYAYEAIKLFASFIAILYNASYQHMMTDPSFNSVPYLGKVIISGAFAGIVPIIILSVLRVVLPALIRGHLQESGLGQIIGTTPPSTLSTNTSKPAGPTEIPLRPYVTYVDPSVHVSRLRKGLGNSWTAEIRKGSNVKTINIGSPTSRGIFRINTFGSDGTVEWGN